MASHAKTTKSKRRLRDIRKLKARVKRARKRRQEMIRTDELLRSATK